MRSVAGPARSSSKWIVVEGLKGFGVFGSSANLAVTPRLSACTAVGIPIAKRLSEKLVSTVTPLIATARTLAPVVCYEASTKQATPGCPVEGTLNSEPSAMGQVVPPVRDSE